MNMRGIEAPNQLLFTQNLNFSLRALVPGASTQRASLLITSITID